MHESIGHTFMYNIIIVFVVIVFAFLAAAMSYYKAFKVNNKIVYAIEKYEGYNDKSIAEIEKILSTLGYDADISNLDCAEEYKGMVLVSGDTPSRKMCIYVDENVANSSKHGSGTYFVYGVKTYMSINLPVVSLLEFPIFTRTNQIYKFTKAKPPIY